jgi:nucleoid-associated protein YgaU
MFDPTSRYAPLRTLTFTLPDGREVSYKERRFLPQVEDVATQGTVTVRPGERLDVLAARVAGDPLQFWRVCDANTIMNPRAENNEPGRVLRIPRVQP